MYFLSEWAGESQTMYALTDWVCKLISQQLSDWKIPIAVTAKLKHLGEKIPIPMEYIKSFAGRARELFLLKRKCIEGITQLLCSALISSTKAVLIFFTLLHFDEHRKTWKLSGAFDGFPLSGTENEPLIRFCISAFNLIKLFSTHGERANSFRAH